MIVREAARLLREARDDEHGELRRVFWIAGRCEYCSAPHCSDGRLVCQGCGRPITNRCAATPETEEEPQRAAPVLVERIKIAPVRDGLSSIGEGSARRFYLGGEVESSAVCAALEAVARRVARAELRVEDGFTVRVEFDRTG